LTIDIPTGWAQATINWTGPTDTGAAATVLGLDVRAATSLTAAAAALSDALESLIVPIMDTDWASTSVRIIDNDNVHEVAAAFSGDRPGASPPPSVCTLIRKRSSLRGRRHSGRIYWPGLLHSDDIDENGFIKPARLDTIDTTFQDAFSAMATDGVVLAILHNDPDEPPTNVSAGIIDRKVATQRRRLR
jgi:hypothetical protein